MSIFLFLLVLVLLYFGWVLTIRAGLNRLSCSRFFSRPAFFEGEEGELIEVIRNDRPIIIPWLRVESRISPYLRLGRQDNLHVSGEMYYCSLFTLMPYQQIRRRHRVKFLHRGAYDLGNAALTSGDLLGACKFLRSQNLSAPVLVYPRLLEQTELPLPVSRMLGQLVRQRQLLTDPFLVRGIRPYTPGDPVRDIHWAATARTGDVQVRIHDYTAKTRLLVVLNVQDQELQWNDYISEQDYPVTEDMIRLAASVCVQGLRAGLSAGFAANMPLGDSKESTVLSPDEQIPEEELLGAFARLTIHRTEKFPALLERLRTYTGMDILILSRYDSGSIRSAMDTLRKDGHTVTLHLMEGGSV